MRDKPLERIRAWWRVGRRARARFRAAAGVTTGCGAVLALAIAPAVAAQGSAATTPATGTITTLAGGVGAPSLATQISLESLNFCAGVQFASGHLYVADQFENVIRAVNTATDAMTTPAGNGQAGYNGDGVPATSTELNQPCTGTVDGAGNLVIADQGNGRVRVVAAKTGTFYGKHMVAGDIYTVASDGSAVCTENHQVGSTFCPADVITDANGNILVSNPGSQQLRQNGGPVPHIVAVPERSGTFYGKKMVAGKKYVLASGGGFQIAVDRSGNVVLAETGQVKVLAEKTGKFYGLAMKRGKTYVVAGTGKSGPSGNGGSARKARLNLATGVAVDHDGNVVIGDVGANNIRVVAVKTGTFYGQHMKAGDIYRIAGVSKGLTGNGVPALKARVERPATVAVDGQGNVVYRNEATIRAVAARTGTFYGQHMKAGDVYTVAGGGTLHAGEGGPATSAQGVTGSVAVDAAGNLLIANGVVRVVAASTGTFYGKAMTKGHIYTIAGSGTRDTGGTAAGDGGPAIKAKLSAADVAVDAAGNLVLTDDNGSRIRVVATQTGTFYGQSMTTGDIYTVAGHGARGFSGDGGPAVSARINTPEGLAIDAAGNLVYLDTGSGLVRVVATATGTFYGQPMTAGDIYTIAGCRCSARTDGDGGPALSASFDFAFGPDQLAIDATGNLVVVDPFHGLIRVIAESTGTFYGQPMTAGDIYAVAGDGLDTRTFANGVPATSSGLALAIGVAVDSHGNLIISDTDNEEVRAVAAATGTFYGVPMTAGDIYAIAGQHKIGMGGDGGPSTSALTCRPDWVIADHGNVIFDDSCNGRIREIQG